MSFDIKTQPTRVAEIVNALPKDARADLTHILAFLRASQEDPDRVHTTDHFAALPSWLRANLSPGSVLRQESIDMDVSVLFELGGLLAGFLAACALDSLIAGHILMITLCTITLPVAGIFSALWIADKIVDTMDACLPSRRARRTARRRQDWWAATQKAMTCPATGHAEEMASMGWKATGTFKETMANAYATMNLDIEVREEMMCAHPAMLSCLDAVVRRHAVARWIATRDSTCGHAMEWSSGDAFEKIDLRTVLPASTQAAETALGRALAATMKKSAEEGCYQVDVAHIQSGAAV